MEVQRDEGLWRMAQKRAKFKRHFATYVIVNGFLWALWFVTGGRLSANLDSVLSAWPIWSTLGWGIGIAFNYLHAYHDIGGKDDVQKEYDKLLNQRKSN